MFVEEFWKIISLLFLTAGGDGDGDGDGDLLKKKIKNSTAKIATIGAIIMAAISPPDNPLE